MKTYFYSIVLHAAAPAPLLKTTTFSVTDVSLAVCHHICMVFPDNPDRTFINDGHHSHNPYTVVLSQRQLRKRWRPLVQLNKITSCRPLLPSNIYIFNLCYPIVVISFDHDERWISAQGDLTISNVFFSASLQDPLSKSWSPYLPSHPLPLHNFLSQIIAFFVSSYFPLNCFYCSKFTKSFWGLDINDYWLALPPSYSHCHPPLSHFPKDNCACPLTRLAAPVMMVKISQNPNLSF